MSGVRRLLAIAKPWRGYLTIGIVCTILTTGAGLVSPIVVRGFIRLIEENSVDIAVRSIYYAVIMMAVSALQCLTQYGKSYYMHLAAWNTVSHIRVGVYNHLQTLSLRYYHDKQTGQLMSRVTGDSSFIEILIAHAAPDLLVNLATLLGVTIMLFVINPLLALINVFILPFVIGSVFWYSKRVRPIFRQNHQKIAEFNAAIHDNISGMKEIQLFNQQSTESERVKKSSLNHIHCTLKALRLSAIYHSAVQMMTQSGTVILIGVGGIMAASGKTGISDIITFLLYLGMFYTPITTMGRLNEDLQNAIAAMERLFDVLDTESDVKDCPNAKVLPRVTGRIDIENVSFCYNEDSSVLKNINLHIKPGELVALVGPTGVGKTTLISLICRMYDPTEGEIRIDGGSLRDYTVHSVRQNISVVLQDVFLFNGTVAENIAYGRKDCTFEEIEAAAKAAKAHEFIDELPHGYKTVIGERGLRLSGGQKQRLSIARAVLRNSPILILDEATASVDMETEKLIYQAMDSLIQNRTTIMIAHRLASVRKADKIVVLDNCGIAQIGRHDELIKMPGLYKTLSNIQFSGLEEYK